MTFHHHEPAPSRGKALTVMLAIMTMLLRSKKAAPLPLLSEVLSDGLQFPDEGRRQAAGPGEEIGHVNRHGLHPSVSGLKHGAMQESIAWVGDTHYEV